MRSDRTLRSALVAIAVAASLLVASPASAGILDGDCVGGVRVGDRPQLRHAGGAPDVYIPAGMLVTIDGRELWSRDRDMPRAMASTTKIMTAVVALEHSNLDDMVTIDGVASSVGESAMNIRPGERLRMGDLLAGVLVQSGNDAATAVAEHVGGTVPAFVGMMNAKAAELNMVNTHYENPHGLDVAGHHTSAADLAIVARYAMRIPEFRRLVGLAKYKVRSDRYTHNLKSHNVLLSTYKGAEGIKTGYTKQAGYCVVVAAKRGSIELVGSVMGASSEGSRAKQAKILLDWGFTHYKPTTVVTEGEPAGRVRVSDYVERTVAARTAETTSLPVFDLAGPVRRRVALRPSVPAPISKGERIGTMTVYQGDAILAQVPVVAAASVPQPTVWQQIGFFFIRTWRGIVEA